MVYSGRSSIGVDLSAKYLDLAVCRVLGMFDTAARIKARAKAKEAVSV